jgi:hypothetical protein
MSVDSDFLMSEIRLALAYLDSFKTAKIDEHAAHYRGRTLECYARVCSCLTMLPIGDEDRELIRLALERVRHRIEAELGIRVA